MPTEFSIQRWLEELPDDEIEREMKVLEEQIQALSARHNTLREARDLKQRFRQFYGGGTPTSVTTVSSAENDAAGTMPFIASKTKVFAPGPPRPSSISKSVRLVLESSKDREWAVADIYSALVERGWLEDSKQSERSLGAALSRMTSDGEIRRVSRGLYAAAPAETVSQSLLDSEGGESG